MLDVVVFPCVPVTAIVGRSRVISPSRSARWSSLPATPRSGLSGAIALERTTSAPSGTLAASCPAATGTSSARRYGESGARSEPVTSAPSSRATRARPLIPAPPMPTKCSRRPCHGLLGTAAHPSLRLLPAVSGNGSSVTDRIDRVAREAFGFEELRPGQREAIESVLAGRDTLVVMSTGSGKSAIYQIAGLLIEGATVVVSPLIALQRDQVEDLGERAAGGAAQLNSTLPAAERERALAELAEDALEFLLLAPEQLANDEVLGQLAAARPSLLVVDEAHCISEWGHDFRPDYLRLGAAAEALGRPTILALTATAAPPVRDEIVERLGLRDPNVLVRGFDRPNIHLAVERFHGDRGAERKLRALLDAIDAAERPGIVYVATRRQAEELAESLCSRDVTAASYHAGMRAGERDDVQERFMDGDLEVVVATTAFGMGIDKADVRWVFHSEVSESLDAYYQEIGRSGRDGEPARAVLFYRSEDLGLRRFFAGTGHVEVDEIARVLESIRHGTIEPAALQEELDLPETKLGTALARLEEAGAIAVGPSGDARGAGGGRGQRRSRAGGGRDRGQAPHVRPLTRGHDARLRRDRRLPAGVHPVVLRRAVRAAVRALRQLRLGPQRGAAGGRAVPGRHPREARELGRGRDPALRRRRDRRAVRRGGLQDAGARGRPRPRAARARLSAYHSPPSGQPPSPGCPQVRVVSSSLRSIVNGPLPEPDATLIVYVSAVLPTVRPRASLSDGSSCSRSAAVAPAKSSCSWW